MGAAVEVLVDEELGGVSARLHWLEGSHGVFETAGEVLDAAGRRVRGADEELTRQSESGAVDELGGGVTEVLFEGRSYAKENERQGGGPSVALVTGSHQG